MPANVVNFIGRGEPAWHGIGTVFNDNPSATEAAKRVGFDYNVEICPTWTKTPWGMVKSPMSSIVREPVAWDENKPRVFGQASSDYQIIKTMDLCASMDRLTEKWPVETAGILHNGEINFMALDAGEITVAGEDIHSFFLAVNNYEPGNAIKFVYTPVRVVCQNTLTTGLRAATSTINLSHTKGIQSRIDMYTDLTLMFQKSQESVKNALTALTVKKVVDAQVDEILANVYKDPSGKATVVRSVEEMADRASKNPFLLPEMQLDEIRQMNADYADYIENGGRRYEAALKAQQKNRQNVKELFEAFGDNHANLGGTAWALYNAVVEWEDYGGKGETANFSRILGPRAANKATAFKFISQAN